MGAPLKFNRVRSAEFNGKRLKVRWRTPRTEYPKTSKFKLIQYGRFSPSRNTLFISPDPKKHPTAIDLFSTILHESGHAAFPQLDEDSMEAFEHDFMTFIGRLGFKIALA